MTDQMHSHSFTKISVIFEDRSDGGVRAYSDDVPGFVLSHKNREALFADVEPALSVILTSMLGRQISVSRLETLRDNLKTQLGEKAPKTESGIFEYVTYAAA